MIVSIIINIVLALIVIGQARSDRFHLMIVEIFAAMVKAAKRKPKQASQDIDKIERL